MTALAATIGTGNIVGVATAIAAGGPGALFWMWVTALVGMATKYSEGYLGVKYRVVDAAGERLRNFVEQAARATLVGDVFDDAATGQGLLNFFLRALNCGAITEEEVLATGLTTEEIQSRSFFRILQGRRQQPA